jgi:hypothetical protein
MRGARSECCGHEAGNGWAASGQMLMTLRRPSISEMGNPACRLSTSYTVSCAFLLILCWMWILYISIFSVLITLLFINSASHSITSEALLQTHPCAIARQLRPEQCKRPLPPIRSRIKRTTECKLIIREVKIPIARNRHCFLLATTIEFVQENLLVSTQLILGSLVNSVIVPFAGL